MLQTLIHLIKERRNVKIIKQNAGSTQNPYLLSEQEEKSTLKKHQENKQRLRVPRRPPWKKSLTPAQLERQEKDAFLEWRRGLAEYISLLANRKNHTNSVLDSRSRTTFSSHPSNEIWKSGVNYGESSSARTLSCKL